MTNRQTSMASAKPLAGAIRKSPRVAPVTSGVDPDRIIVMTATIASRMKMMEKDVSIFLFFFGAAASDISETPFEVRHEAFRKPAEMKLEHNVQIS
jgi:predicted peroxiredoxin